MLPEYFVSRRPVDWARRKLDYVGHSSRFHRLQNVTTYQMCSSVFSEQVCNSR